jgi:transcriptional regulator with XRE-family HTH domain
MSTARCRGERQWLASAFAATLQELTTARNFDAVVLAERSGIELGALARLFSGTRLPDLDTLFVLARALDLAPEVLVTRTAMYREWSGYQHHVPIVFLRSQRIFRLIGADSREKHDCYEDWLAATKAAARAPGSAIAIAIYCRTTIAEL